MKRVKNVWLLNLAFFLSLALPGSGCVTQIKGTPQETEVYSKLKGYAIELGEVRAGSFETAEYIPEKIRFELLNSLRQRSLLEAPSVADKRLIVTIETKATYPPFASGEFYRELESIVQLSDIEQKQVIAKRVLHIYNAFGSWTSDFTEMTHAKEIADFIESVVR